MSPGIDEALHPIARFPRSRGDEPDPEWGLVDVAVFSPLTRG